MSHQIAGSNSLSEQQVTSNAAARCSAGCSEERAEGGIPDPDLARLVAAWPTLPDVLKSAIVAIVNAAGPMTSGECS